MEKELLDMLDYAEKNGTIIITTIEAFHKEPDVLYEFLNRAANRGISVTLASIKTTDQSYAAA